jgi:hypothetical protein
MKRSRNPKGRKPDWMQRFGKTAGFAGRRATDDRETECMVCGRPAVQSIVNADGVRLKLCANHLPEPPRPVARDRHGRPLGEPPPKQ